MGEGVPEPGVLQAVERWVLEVLEVLEVWEPSEAQGMEESEHHARPLVCFQPCVLISVPRGPCCVFTGSIWM